MKSGGKQRTLLQCTGGDNPGTARKKAKATGGCDAAGDGAVLRVASWNTDGLEEQHLMDRAGEICSILLEAPLQEVVGRTAGVFRGRLGASGYCCVSPPPDAAYFTLMFLREKGPNSLRLVDAERAPFPRSAMGRDLITARVTFAGSRVRLMTAHFESLQDGGVERRAQLRVVAQGLQGIPDEAAVFAGDTNLRDEESAAEPLLAGVLDAWEAAGADAGQRFTWDMARNQNKVMSGKVKPRKRFDRMLASGVQGVQNFRLLGTERMAEGCHPSDHFGIGAEVVLTAPAASSAATAIVIP